MASTFPVLLRVNCGHWGNERFAAALVTAPIFFDAESYADDRDVLAVWPTSVRTLAITTATTVQSEEGAEDPENFVDKGVRGERMMTRAIAPDEMERAGADFAVLIDCEDGMQWNLVSDEFGGDRTSAFALPVGATVKLYVGDEESATMEVQRGSRLFVPAPSVDANANAYMFYTVTMPGWRFKVDSAPRGLDAAAVSEGQLMWPTLGRVRVAPVWTECADAVQQRTLDAPEGQRFVLREVPLQGSGPFVRSVGPFEVDPRDFVHVGHHTRVDQTAVRNFDFERDSAPNDMMANIAAQAVLDTQRGVPIQIVIDEARGFRPLIPVQTLILMQYGALPSVETLRVLRATTQNYRELLSTVANDNAPRDARLFAKAALIALQPRDKTVSWVAEDLMALAILGQGSAAQILQAPVLSSVYRQFSPPVLAILALAAQGKFEAIAEEIPNFDTLVTTLPQQMPRDTQAAEQILHKLGLGLFHFAEATVFHLLDEREDVKESLLELITKPAENMPLYGADENTKLLFLKYVSFFAMNVIRRMDSRMTETQQQLSEDDRVRYDSALFVSVTAGGIRAQMTAARESGSKRLRADGGH